MEDTLRDPLVQEPLLQRLKSDDRLAGYLFQSAYTGALQKDLLEACDLFEEAALKEHLQTLLAKILFSKGLIKTSPACDESVTGRAGCYLGRDLIFLSLITLY